MLNWSNKPFPMEQQAKAPTCNADNPVVPKVEIEIIFERDDNKDLIVPKEELMVPEEELPSTSVYVKEEWNDEQATMLVPIKTETVLSKDLNEIRIQQEKSGNELMSVDKDNSTGHSDSRSRQSRSQLPRGRAADTRTPLLCSVCSYTCKKTSYLAVHMRTHTGEKPYTCDICHAKFAQKSNLTIHMRTHSGEKRFPCEFCPAKFAEKRTLTIHKRTHTGEKPYDCDQCEAKFAQKCNLTVHMRTHTGEKRFTCDFCGSKFVEKQALVTHMRTHTGEKPYSCDLCNAKFAQLSTLNTHIKTHTW